MLRLATLLVVLGSVAPTRADTYSFELVDGWEWGGQRLVAPRALLPAMAARPSLRKQPAYGVVFPAHASIALGDEKPADGVNVVLALPKGKPPCVYVDANRDREIAAEEGVELTPGAVDFGPCKGRPAAEVELTVDLTQDGKTTQVTRRGAIWQGDSLKVPLFALKGFLQGDIEVDGAKRPAFVADANANGQFHDEYVDQLWIDLNGDGKLDVLSEQFPVTSMLRVGARKYNLAVSSVSRQVAFTRVEGGMGTAKLTHAPDSGKALGVSATLIGKAGEVVGARKLDEDIDLPAGEYQISALALRLKAKSGTEWAYAFSNWTDARNVEDSHPLKIAKGESREVAPLTTLKLTPTVTGERRLGETLSVQPIAKTEAGLALTDTRQGELRSWDQAAPKAVLELLDPGGEVVTTATSGFS